MSRETPTGAVALIDVEYLREKVAAHEPLSAEDLQAAVDAALSLAAALERVKQLQTSRIGAEREGEVREFVYARLMRTSMYASMLARLVIAQFASEKTQ
jgi:hypothetical protein